MTRLRLLFVATARPGGPSRAIANRLYYFEPDANPAVIWVRLAGGVSGSFKKAEPLKSAMP